MIDFHQTPMGRQFFDKTVPELVRQLARLNDNLERMHSDEDRERIRFLESLCLKMDDWARYTAEWENAPDEESIRPQEFTEAENRTLWDLKRGKARKG